MVDPNPRLVRDAVIFAAERHDTEIVAKPRHPCDTVGLQPRAGQQKPDVVHPARGPERNAIGGFQNPCRGFAETERHPTGRQTVAQDAADPGIIHDPTGGRVQCRLFPAHAARVRRSLRRRYAPHATRSRAPGSQVRQVGAVRRCRSPRSTFRIPRRRCRFLGRTVLSRRRPPCIAAPSGCRPRNKYRHG